MTSEMSPSITIMKTLDDGYWDDLQQFYLSGKFQDVRLVTEDKMVIFTNRLLLASMSSNLKQVLLQENVEEEELRTIVVPGCDGKRLKEFVDSLYAFLARKVSWEMLQRYQDIIDLLGMNSSVVVDSNGYNDDEISMVEDFKDEPSVTNEDLSEDEVCKMSESEEEKDTFEVEVKENFNIKENIKGQREDNMGEVYGAGVKEKEQRPVAMKRKLTVGKKMGKADRAAEKMVDKEKNIWKSMLTAANKSINKTAEELYQMMKRASDSMVVTFFPSVLDANVHCTPQLNKQTKFQALVSVRKTEKANRFMAMPLAWSKVNSDEIEKQFEMTSSVLRSLFGFSDAQLFYDKQFFSRMKGHKAFYGGSNGTTKRYTTLCRRSRKDKIKYIVTRRMAGCTDEEFDLKLKDKEIVEYTTTGPCKEAMTVAESFDYELKLTNLMVADEVEGLALISWDVVTGCPFARLIEVKHEERDAASVDIHKVMFDVWSNGESFGLIPPVESILKKIEKMYYPMETYLAIHDFRETDPTGEKRRELTGKSELCEDCGKCFPVITAANLSAYKAHRISHILNDTKCDCNVEFLDENIKSDHIKLVHIEGYEKCPGCSKVLNSNIIEKHARRHCPGADEGSFSFLQKKRHSCKICSKVSNSLLSHLTHMTMHEEHTCPHCGLEITSRRSFKTHLRTVHKVSYVCKKCGVDYLNQDQLDKHFKVCQGCTVTKKPAEIFTCEHCGLSGFTNSGSMYKHMFKEHNIKRFSCDKCDKQFTWRCELRSHTEAVHLRLLKYPCRFECGKTYVDNPSRCHHESKVHGISYVKKMKEQRERQGEPSMKRAKISK